MSVLGPAEVLVIAAIAFHLLLLSHLGWRGYLWCRVVAAMIVARQPSSLLKIAALCLLLEAAYTALRHLSSPGESVHEA